MNIIVNGDSVEIPEKANEVYSTDEVIVGTWIDGKPLYRRVIKGSFSNVSIYKYYNFSEEISPVKMQGVVFSNSGSVLALPYIRPSGEWTYANYDSNNKRIIVFTDYDRHANQPFTFIIEYTKDSDQV